MKLNILDIGGKIVKEDERYIVKDNSTLKNLIVSSTDLKPGKSTSGHNHPGQEEVYNFVKGKGLMKIDEDVFPVSEGDVILIEDGQFHQVINDSTENLYFVCVFDGSRSH
ncbi:MAG: cupin domain-containing protein [Gammaproteobacteria bacterium]|nr:MAG: cupin domain-containing protein [Gammaproteobacteria bacterium]|tara:strand:- start:1918 stop:2247 length:330 start_codon:yes stop_codon:yes gene_type:complete